MNKREMCLILRVVSAAIFAVTCYISYCIFKHDLPIINRGLSLLYLPATMGIIACIPTPENVEKKKEETENVKEIFEPVEDRFELLDL